jgi:alpha-tubulin suppressor-like RCC1 family protein
VLPNNSKYFRRMIIGIVALSIIGCAPGQRPFGTDTRESAETAPDAIKAISAGLSHTCALSQSGGVTCWGWNVSGQLGDGTRTSRDRPVEVMGMTSGVTAIATGMSYTCALTADGAVKCWGENGSGQLGDGTSVQRLTPTDVTGLASGVTALAAGAGHTCALTEGGGVKCWGENFSGQLGDGTSSQRLSPTDVKGLMTGVANVVASGDDTCVLTTGGGVKCWGDNDSGRLGDGSTAGSLEPVNVNGLSSGVTAIAAGGGHACAVTSGGGVKCWGYNGDGALGDGTTNNRIFPMDVRGIAGGAKAISTGECHTCALLRHGNVMCWGENYFGELGVASRTDHLTPVNVRGLGIGVTALASGGGFSCAVIEGGVRCWGFNNYGQLGDGTTIDSDSPVDVVGLQAG